MKSISGMIFCVIIRSKYTVSERSPAILQISTVQPQKSLLNWMAGSILNQKHLLMMKQELVSFKIKESL